MLFGSARFVNNIQSEDLDTFKPFGCSKLHQASIFSCLAEAVK